MTGPVEYLVVGFPDGTVSDDLAPGPATGLHDRTAGCALDARSHRSGPHRRHTRAEPAARIHRTPLTLTSSGPIRISLRGRNR